MVSSSFHTENCCTYLGSVLINHAPYLCMLSAIASYLSAGFVSGASSVPTADRGAFRMLGASLGMCTVKPRIRLLVDRHREEVAAATATDGDAEVVGAEGLLAPRAEARALLR